MQFTEFGTYLDTHQKGIEMIGIGMPIRSCLWRKLSSYRKWCPARSKNQCATDNWHRVR